MITAYLEGRPSLYEGEDIGITYCIYEEESLIGKESISRAYEKPAVVGQVALAALLRALMKHKEKEILIIVNDGALSELVKGTSTTKNKDVLKMAREMKKDLAKFEYLLVKDVSGNHKERLHWLEMLTM